MEWREGPSPAELERGMVIIGVGDSMALAEGVVEARVIFEGAVVDFIGVGDESTARAGRGGWGSHCTG